MSVNERKSAGERKKGKKKHTSLWVRNIDRAAPFEGVGKSVRLLREGIKDNVQS
jgi:hypothetical protein